MASSSSTAEPQGHADRRRVLRPRGDAAPDLVVEILSPRTARRDRTVKLAWYRRYGVHECWLVDPRAQTVEIVDLTTTMPARLFRGGEPIRSDVLPQWTASADRIFA